MWSDHRPFDELMRRELSRIGFDFERPHPAVAWEAFKAFVVRPIPDQKTITIGFECYHARDRDDVLWLSFVRQMQDDAGNGQNCGCVFTRAVPDHMIGIHTENWWWEGARLAGGMVHRSGSNSDIHQVPHVDRVAI